jgi:hypothetical protein
MKEAKTMKTIKINVQDNDIIEGIVTFIQDKFKYEWKDDNHLLFNKGKKEGNIKFPNIEEENGVIVMEYDNDFDEEISTRMAKLKEDITTEDLNKSVFTNLQSTKIDFLKLGKNKDVFLELDKFFKRYRIEKVGFNKDFSTNYQNYCAKELSLLFYPYAYNGAGCNYSYESLIKYKELISISSIPCSGENIQKMSDEKEEIILMNKLEIGRYYRDRNLIMIWINPFFYSELKNKVSYTDDKFLDEFLPDLMKAISGLKPEKVNVDNFSIRLIVDTFKKEQKKLLSGAKKKLEEAERNIKDYETSLTSLYEQRVAQINLLEQINVPCKDVIEEELKKLKENKLLEKVELKDGGIVLTFKETSIRCPFDRSVDAGDGKFGIVDMYLGRISFKLNGSNDLFVSSDAPYVDGHPHPHANTDGRPCLGDGSGKLQILRLLGERKLNDLTYQLWMWIKTYRSANAYVKVYNWYDDRLRQGYPVFDAKGNRIEINDAERIKTGEQIKLTKKENYKDNYEKTKDFKPSA